MLQGLGREHHDEVIILGKDEDTNPGRLSIDTISATKAVFRTPLSLHYKSELVSRPILNTFSQIDAVCRMWPFMKHHATQFPESSDS